jgi:serine/threonine-protein kinase
MSLRQEGALPERLSHYALGYLIAASSNAFVYEARDERTNRTVALKVLRAERMGAERSVERFRREAEVAMRLRHPKIVEVLEAGDAGGQLYIAMELVRGPNLHQYVQRRGPLKVRRLLRIGAQVMEALAFAHEAGVVHRDVKPSNVLLARPGVVKVSDFGLAGDRTLTGEEDPRMIGSAVCMPPEQVRGEPADVRSDVYGVGCVLYYMAAGRFPFEGDRVALLRAHLREEPSPPSRWAAKVPGWVDRAVLGCLAKERDGRWADMRALWAALAEGAGGKEGA